MATWPRAASAALAAGVVVASLAACGGGGRSTTEPLRSPSWVDRPGLQILEDGLREVSAIRSARLQVTFRQHQRTYRMDVASDRSGSCAGSLTLDGLSGYVIDRGGRTYMQGDARFLEALVQQDGPAPSSLLRALATVGDRWISFPTNAEMDQGCNLAKTLGPFDGLSDQIEKKATDRDIIDKGPVVDVLGTRSVEVRVPDGGETVLFWFAVDEPHYLTRVGFSGSSSDAGSSVLLSAFNQPVKAHVPAGGEIVDMEDLKDLLRPGT